MNNRGNQQHGDLQERTDVLDNVSRETSENKLTKKQIREKARLDKVRKKGGITDDDPFDFNNPSLRELYGDFRRNGLSIIESSYNALYLWCYDNYYSSGVPIKEKYKNIHAHPTSWFRNTHDMWQHNKWSVAAKLLDIIPKIAQFFERTSKSAGSTRERLLRAFEYSHRSARRATAFFGYLIAVVGIAGIVLVWHDHAQQLDLVPALKLYIDGEYVGNVLSVSEAQSAKTRLNHDLSVRFGFPYSLDYELTYEPTKINEGENLTQAKLSSAFGKAADNKLVEGYGLYSPETNRLILVSPEKSWIDECREELIQNESGGKKRNADLYFSQDYDNKGTYPKEMMVGSLEELKQKFSLIPTEQTDEQTESATATPSSETVVGTSSDISSTQAEDPVSSIIAKAQINSFSSITVQEKIPYSTTVEYSDELPENRTIVTSEGRNGSKRATYFVTYDSEGNEIDRKLYNEVIISQPKNKVVTRGTRPLTEEEKRTMSTGTYILPTSGPLSSSYGWRQSFNEFHKGVDMNSTGEADLKIVAADGGVVIEAGDRKNGYGLCILIQHDDGTLTKYAHCSALYVEEGQRVAQGEEIARMGTTGWSTGVHLHFEIIRDDEYLNPQEYLPPIRRR